jgi:hypothetical protein
MMWGQLGIAGALLQGPCLLPLLYQGQSTESAEVGATEPCCTSGEGVLQNGVLQIGVPQTGGTVMRPHTGVI